MNARQGSLRPWPPNDSLIGGSGADVFVFQPGFGNDIVGDFQASGAGHDVLQVSTSVFADWASLLARTSQSGADVLIRASAADTLRLANVSLASLMPDDVRFTA